MLIYSYVNLIILYIHLMLIESTVFLKLLLLLVFSIVLIYIQWYNVQKEEIFMNRMKQRLLTFMISAALVIGIFPAIPAIADTDDNTS